MIIYCSCCSKQVVRDYNPPRHDKYVTKYEGARADFPPNVICGYCAEELDEYGMFPEERAQYESGR